MAAPTVTIGPTSRTFEFPPTNKRKLVAATVVCDGTVGGAVNDIPASLFGLSYIERSEVAIKNDNTLLVVLAPSYDGTSLLGKAAASAAPAAIPAGTYSVVLFGY